MSEKAKVYFSKEISPEKVLEMYQLLGKKLEGKVAIKLHSGEVGNQNFLKPEFWKPVIDHVGGTVVECNTAYDGARNTTAKHMKTMREHGWSKYFEVDLLDAEGPDMELPIPNGKVIHKNSAGKAYIHGAGEPEKIWTADHDSFLESMADAASSVVEYFKGNAIYINVMKNMSVDCDCCAVAEDPCMKDMGILISTDPIAIDQACLDLVYASDDPGRDHLLERIESRHGVHTIEAAAALGFGTREYELITVS